MKAHLTPLFALSFIVGTIDVHSQTLNWASFTNSTIVDSEGDPLDSTFLFQLGVFDASFVPEESNVGEWSGKWTTFDTADYSYNAVDLGHFAGSQVIQEVPNYAAMFQGLKAYLWIRNASGTEFFLASAVSWTFPVAETDCCPTGVTTWSISDFGTGTPIWGSQNGNDGAGEFTPGPYELQTHAVPEPSFSLLGMVGCGVMLLRRHRK